MSTETQRTDDPDVIGTGPERERFLADVVETADMPFGVGTPDGRLLTFNQAFADLTGYNRDELLQRQFTWATDLTPEEWRASENARLAEAVRTRQPVRYEKEYIRKDGTRVPVELFVQPAFDAAGNLLHFRCFLSNITARKQAEEALRQSEDRYRLMFDTMLEGFCIIEVLFDAHDKPVDYRFLETNAAFEKQTGLHDAQGRRMRDLAPEHEAHWFEIYGKIALTGAPARFINEAKALNRWFDVSAYRIGGAESRNVAILFNDITEAKRAEAEVRRNLQLLQAVIDNSQALIYVKDLDGRIIIANQSLGDVVGMPPRNILGKTSREIISDPKASEAHMANDRRVIETGQAVTMEETTPGHVFLSVKFPLRDDRDDIFGTGGISTDITVLKKNADELHKANRTLQALSLSDRAFLHVESEEAYLREICRIIVQNCGHAMVWVGYAEENAGKTVRPVASAGFEEGYLQTLNVTWADNERGRGPTGTAIRTGRPCVCANMLADLAFAPWREQAIKRGYASSLVVPLLNNEPVSAGTDDAAMVGGKAFGAITVYSREPDAFTADEVELLSALAFDLAHGITLLRLRAANQRVNDELKKSEATLKGIFDATRESIWLFSPDGVILMGNETAFSRIGRPGSELVGKKIIELPPLDVSRARLLKLQEVVQSAQPLEFEDARNGIDFRHTFYPVLDAGGQVASVVSFSRDITASKQADAALRASEANYRSLIETAGEGIAVARPDGQITFINQRMSDLLGYSQEELLGKRGIDLVDEESKPAVFALRKEVMAGKVVIQELKFRHKDGSYHWMLCNCAPLRDGQGNYCGQLVMHTDVTERKQAEAALAESRERLERALASSEMATFEWDIVANRRIWSDGVHCLLGTTPATFKGTTEEFLQIIHPDDRMPVQAALIKALETDVYQAEYRAVWPDGSVHNIAAKGKVHCDGDGRPVRMAGICWDITERKRAEGAVRSAHEKLALAQRSADAGSWEWDMRTNKLDWSPELFHLFGLIPARTEANFDLWRQVMHPDDRQKTEESLKTAIREHTKVVNEYRIVLPSGDARWIHAVGETTYDEKDQPVRMAGLCFDITDRKLTEEKVRQQAEELTRFNRVMVDRELRMIELKKQVNDLCAQLGQPKKYPLSFEKREQ
jgi:PAS domain S-box-containing protein